MTLDFDAVAAPDGMRTLIRPGLIRIAFPDTETDDINRGSRNLVFTQASVVSRSIMITNPTSGKT